MGSGCGTVVNACLGTLYLIGKTEVLFFSLDADDLFAFMAIVVEQSIDDIVDAVAWRDL